MKDQEFYDRLYRLCYINRYPTVPRVKDENVCEHSFLVSALVLQLHTEYVFDLGKALTIAISHDILENETGDVGHLVKKQYPKLYESLKSAEKEAIDKYPPAVKWGIRKYDSNDTVESYIVHLADSMQCHQYATNEIRLGSAFYFDEVKEKSMKRINRIRIQIEKYARTRESKEKQWDT